MTFPTFRVDAIMGYRKDVAYSHSTAYGNFKMAVRAIANQAGVPDLATTTMQVDVEIHWTKRARLDGDNVLKAVVDGLFRQDRLLAGASWRRDLGAPSEYLIVTVSW